MEKEPRHYDTLEGRIWLLNDDVVIENVSFNGKADAEAWGRWSNFGDKNPFKIIYSPSVKVFKRPPLMSK